MQRFNSALGIPQSLISPLFGKTVGVKYGNHAKMAAKGDKYGDVTPFLPNRVRIGTARIVEVETNDGVKLEKLIVRLVIDGERDLCLVLTPSAHDSGEWFAKTVWVNLINDQHTTLNREAYSIPA